MSSWGIFQCQARIMHEIIFNVKLGHISMSCRDYACWRNNFQIMQILGVLCEPQFIRSIVVHPGIVVKCLYLSQCFGTEKKQLQKSRLLVKQYCIRGSFVSLIRLGWLQGPVSTSKQHRFGKVRNLLFRILLKNLPNLVSFAPFVHQIPSNCWIIGPQYERNQRKGTLSILNCIKKGKLAHPDVTTKKSMKFQGFLM